MVFFAIFFILFHISIAAKISKNEYIYTDTSVHLSSKKTNLYYINEMTNVCFENGKFIFFNPSESEKEKLLDITNASGFSSQVKEDTTFSKEIRNMNEFQKDSLGLFLATTSSEDFQTYRLYNSILYLHRNTIDLSTVSAVYVYTGRKETQHTKSIITHYSTAIHSLIGNNLKIRELTPFCLQQLIFITPRDNIKDVIYQMDSIYLKKLVYKGKPKYPIPQRKANILVNFRREAPKWAEEEPVEHYFDKIERMKKTMTYVHFSELTHVEIVEYLKGTDIFVTVYGDESVFLVFLVPYSVFVEVQPDYFHDSTTSVIAYASDIYPIILRDVYSKIPSECKVENGLIQSEDEPCRTVLKYREIQFDIKSMTQAMAQSLYYLNNYKMKAVKYFRVYYIKQYTIYTPKSSNSL